MLFLLADQMKNLLPKSTKTPYGPLYQPVSRILQFSILFVAVVISLILGAILGASIERDSIGVYFYVVMPYFSVIVFGYVFWVARLKTLAFGVLGKSVLWAVIKVFILRRKPEKLEELMPSREKFEEMAVLAQAAAACFWRVAIIMAGIWLVSVIFLSAFLPHTGFAIIVFASVILWGVILSYLGRRGYLPILEEG